MIVALCSHAWVSLGPARGGCWGCRLAGLCCLRHPPLDSAVILFVYRNVERKAYQSRKIGIRNCFIFGFITDNPRIPARLQSNTPWLNQKNNLTCSFYNLFTTERNSICITQLANQMTPRCTWALILASCGLSTPRKYAPTQFLHVTDY